MIRTQIQLTEEQSRRVKEVAEREDISMAELIRKAIDEWLQRRYDLSEAERWEKSLEVIDNFRSGISDLAENHDNYLVEAYEDIEDK